MKYLLHRAKFYFCEELPEDAVAKEPKEGTLRPELFIPLEDIYSGRKQAGEVGQEVYGSAAAFILTTAAYVNKPELPFVIRTEYPVLSFEFERGPDGGHASVKLAGDPAYECNLTVASRREPLRLQLSSKSAPSMRPRRKAGVNTYIVRGGSTYDLTWKVNVPAKRRESIRRPSH
jgi:hypothetical protein